MIKKNIFEIISEAAKAETVFADNIFEDDIMAEFGNVYKEMEEVDYVYTVESVPVFDAGDGNYFIEADSVAKLMEASDDDISSTLDNIAEHYDIPVTSIGIVFESDDYAEEVLEEAKKHKAKAGDLSKFAPIKATTKVAEELKEKGVKLFKKKGKKSSKKKKKC